MYRETMLLFVNLSGLSFGILALIAAYILLGAFQDTRYKFSRLKALILAILVSCYFFLGILAIYISITGLIF